MKDFKAVRLFLHITGHTEHVHLQILPSHLEPAWINQRGFNPSGLKPLGLIVQRKVDFCTCAIQGFFARSLVLSSPRLEIVISG